MSINNDVFISSSSLDHVQVFALSGMMTPCSRINTAVTVLPSEVNSHLDGFIVTSGFMASPFSKTSTSSNRELKRNNDFVRLEEDFNAELERKGINLGDQSYAILQNVRQYISALLDLKPSAISVQATYDRSVLFTLKVGEYIGYFEYWIDYNLSGYDDPIDEMVLNLFKNKEHILNFSGEFIQTFAEFVNVTKIKSVPIPVPA